MVSSSTVAPPIATMKRADGNSIVDPQLPDNTSGAVNGTGTVLRAGRPDVKLRVPPMERRQALSDDGIAKRQSNVTVDCASVVSSTEMNTDVPGVSRAPIPGVTASNANSGSVDT